MMHGAQHEGEFVGVLHMHNHSSLATHKHMHKYLHPLLQQIISREVSRVDIQGALCQLALQISNLLVFSVICSSAWSSSRLVDCSGPLSAVTDASCFCMLCSLKQRLGAPPAVRPSDAHRICPRSLACAASNDIEQAGVLALLLVIVLVAAVARVDDIIVEIVQRALRLRLCVRRRRQSMNRRSTSEAKSEADWLHFLQRHDGGFGALQAHFNVAVVIASHGQRLLHVALQRQDLVLGPCRQRAMPIEFLSITFSKSLAAFNSRRQRRSRILPVAPLGTNHIIMMARPTAKHTFSSLR